MPGVGGVNKYTGKQYEYFETPTSGFIWENAKYASNYCKAIVQGVMDWAALPGEKPEPLAAQDRSDEPTDED